MSLPIQAFIQDELLYPVGTAIKNVLHNSRIISSLGGGALINSLLQPYNLRYHPDGRIEEFEGRKVRLIEIAGIQGAYSFGTSKLPLIGSVIFIQRGLKEIAPDAYRYFLKREIILIDSYRSIIGPTVNIITSLALTVLIPNSWPLWALGLTWITVSFLSSTVMGIAFKVFAEKRVEDQRGYQAAKDYSKVLRGAKITDELKKYEPLQKQDPDPFVLDFENQIRPSRTVLEKETKEVQQSFENRLIKFRKDTKEKVIRVALPIIANCLMLVPLQYMIPLQLLPLTAPVTLFLGGYITRPYLLNRVQEQRKRIDNSLTPQDRQLISSLVHKSPEVFSIG